MLKISEIKIDIPKYPKMIIDTLKNAGFDAYIVGGCVRDVILGKTPSDYDITTNAKPFDVKSLFKRTIDTGIKHGTVSVLFYENDKPLTYEVTTYRIDGEYEDGRHPNDVVFCEDLKEDLLRRDFTVNALAYNDDRGLVDEFGGVVDIEKKIIRAVGNPYDRFKEDALRLLRAIRFASKLSFEIEEDTLEAIPELSYNLSNVSKERVQVELTKTLIGNSPNKVSLIFSLGLAPYICKNFELIIPGNLKSNMSVHSAYASFLYNTSNIVVSEVLRELKLDNNNISKITQLLNAKKYYLQIIDAYKKDDYVMFRMTVKQLINFLKYDLIFDFIDILYLNENEDKVKIIDLIKETINEIHSQNIPVFLSDLNISGNDVLNVGFRGEEIGVALAECLKIVHKNSEFNDKKLLQEILIKAYNIYKGNLY